MFHLDFVYNFVLIFIISVLHGSSLYLEIIHDIFQNENQWPHVHQNVRQLYYLKIVHVFLFITHHIIYLYFVEMCKANS